MDEHDVNKQDTDGQTRHIDSDIPIDTGIRKFQNETDTMRELVPGKSRILRLYMPQQPDPFVLIDADELIIGRTGGENRLDLSLQYGGMLGVSREHAKITFVDGQYFIADLNSSNGTYLNNQKLPDDSPHVLERSDQLRFGHFVMIINFS